MLCWVDCKIDKYDFFVADRESAKVISRYDLILDGTDGAGANAGDKVQHDDVLDANAIPQSFGQSAQFRANTKFLNETLTIPQGVNAMAVGPLTVTSGNTLTIEGDVVIL